jgi:hypothetical protein
LPADAPKTINAQYATRTLNLRHTAASGTSMPGLNPRP